MTDKPILFKAPMVRAILREVERPGSGKTQTRRVLKPFSRGLKFVNLAEHGERRGYSGRFNDPASWGHPFAEDGCDMPISMWPECWGHQVGDRLWVREPWRTFVSMDAVAPRDLWIEGERGAGIRYEADGSGMSITALGDRYFGSREHEGAAFGKPRPGTFLPRWASRLTLTVAAVKVERLQDISEADAIAEGMQQNNVLGDEAYGAWTGGVDYVDGETARGAFKRTWRIIHGPDAWAANPWVAAYTFTPALGNADAEPRP